MSCKVSDFGLSRELADDNPDSEYETQVYVVGFFSLAMWLHYLNNEVIFSSHPTWSKLTPPPPQQKTKQNKTKQQESNNNNNLNNNNDKSNSQSSSRFIHPSFLVALPISVSASMAFFFSFCSVRSSVRLFLFNKQKKNKTKSIQGRK